MADNLPVLLLVEDDEPYARLIEAHVADLVFVIHAVTHQEALAAIRNFAVDVVLYDLGLPDVGSSLEDRTGALGVVCASVRSPVVVLTGENRAGALDMCLDVGADDYIRKPCDREGLRATLRLALRRRSPAALAIGIIQMIEANTAQLAQRYGLSA